MASQTVPRAANGTARKIAHELFQRVARDFKPDRSLPATVVKNRLRRAEEKLADVVDARGSAKIPPEVRARLETIVEDWANRSFEEGFKDIEDLEIKWSREQDLVEAEESGDPKQVLAVLEKTFRSHVIEQYGSIELRGLQISHRVILDLDEVYVPLHVSNAVEPNATTPELPWQVLDLTQAFQRHSHLVVVGAPGSGKSTVIGYLATGIADGRFSREAHWTDRPLPITLVVRELGDVRLTPDWFNEATGIDRRLVQEAIKKERIVLLIDGLDEATRSLREQLIPALGEFLIAHPRIRVLVTSRPFGGSGEAHTCLPEFSHYDLSDFDSEDIETFVDKWCLAAEKSVRKDPTEASDQARLSASDLKSRIRRSRPIQRLAVNPLVATILCVVHRFLGRSIPEHRTLLYDKCTDALLYEWDRAKFPTGAVVGTLDAPQKRKLLQGVARWVHEQHAAEIAEQDVIRHFARALPSLGKPESDAQRIVHEIQDRSGLLVERRPGIFGFSHLTFQEYLTALDYVYAGDLSLLLDRYDDPWWHEVTALAAGVPGAAPTLVKGLLEKGDKSGVLLAAQCIETAIDIPASVRSQFDSAAERMLPWIDWCDIQLLTSIGITAGPLFLKQLSMDDPAAKSTALFAFEGLDYEPAIPAIAQSAGDVRKSFASVHGLLTIGEHAAWILLRKSLRSESARRAFLSTLPKLRSKEFLTSIRADVMGPRFLPLLRQELTQAIDGALKNLPSPSRRPRKPKSSPSTRPSKRVLGR